MSFAANIKGELSRLPLRSECCRRAELAALILINGNLQLSAGNRMYLNVGTEHAAIARRLYNMFKLEFEIQPRILVRKKIRLRKNLSYLVQIDNQQKSRAVVAALGILGTDNSLKADTDSRLVVRRCCKRAYLRGCFIAGGSVSNPEHSGYHMEIATEYSRQASFIQTLLAEFGIKSGNIQRKQNFVVYIKDSAQIADLLSLIGTNQGRLIFENAKIYKDIRNNVNRLVNCETANLNKTVNAAQRQIASIRRLEQTVGLDSLSPGLRLVARLRLEFPEATLEELGAAATPPLNKSAVNYRLRRLQKLADEILP
ncbi:MAG: DNA-binding protein WhiA [Firmicutes bacterium]|nr:DNA-binding protein WhiA [Bacillota bacterium]